MTVSGGGFLVSSLEGSVRNHRSWGWHSLSQIWEPEVSPPNQSLPLLCGLTPHQRAGERVCLLSSHRGPLWPAQPSPAQPDLRRGLVPATRAVAAASFGCCRRSAGVPGRGRVSSCLRDQGSAPTVLIRGTFFFPFGWSSVTGRTGVFLKLLVSKLCQGRRSASWAVARPPPRPP